MNKKPAKNEREDTILAILLGLFGGMALGVVLEHAVFKHGYLMIKNRQYLILSLRNIATIFAIGTFFGILICLIAIGLGGIC